MKRIILLSLMVWGCQHGFAQNKLKSHNKKFIFKVVEQMPEFPGGDSALYQYISSSVRYPDSAVYFKKEATVKVKFIVDEYGSIDSVSTKEQFGYGLNKEAEKVIANMPPWKPARNNGKPVKVYYQIPIKFVLSDDDKLNNDKPTNAK